MTLETILLAVGPRDTVRTDRLGDVVTDVAGPLDVTVVVAHAFTADEYDEMRDELGFETVLENVDPDEVAARRAPIADFVDVFEEAGIDCEVRGVVGSYAAAIVDLATEVEADRIVVGGRRRSPAGKAVFGSTSQEIMHSAPCPVTYVGDRGVFE